MPSPCSLTRSPMWPEAQQPHGPQAWAWAQLARAQLGYRLTWLDGGRIAGDCAKDTEFLDPGLLVLSLKTSLDFFCGRTDRDETPELNPGQSFVFAAASSINLTSKPQPPEMLFPGLCERTLFLLAIAIAVNKTKIPFSWNHILDK